MNGLVKTLLVIVALAAFAFGFLWLTWARVSWRQTLTVAVETPQGPIAGASVQQVGKYDKAGPFKAITPIEARGVDSTLRGEAVVVDLGESRYLFALLKGADFLAQNTFAEEIGLGKPGVKWPRWAEAIPGLKGAKPVPRRYYPTLVTFDDIADPKTVRRIDPDDLDGAFGLCPDGSGLKDAEAPWRAEKMIWLNWARWQASGLSREAYRQKYEQGYPRADWIAALDAKVTPRDRSTDCRRLAAITLEITQEPVTEGRVEGVLGWLGKYPEPGLCPSTGSTTDIPFCRRVHHGDFIRR
jgi:hypothetical protein